MAQFGSVLGLEPRSRWFESNYPDIGAIAQLGRACD